MSDGTVSSSSPQVVLSFSDEPVLLRLLEGTGATVGMANGLGGVLVNATVEQWSLIAGRLAQAIDDYHHARGELQTPDACRAASQALTSIREAPAVRQHDDCFERAVEKLSAWVTTHHRANWPLQELDEAEVPAALTAINAGRVFEVRSQRGRNAKFYMVRLSSDGLSAFRVVSKPPNASAE